LRTTPKAVQDLLEELEASRQSRLRAWEILQEIRQILTSRGNVPIAPPKTKTIDAEGQLVCRDCLIGNR
jgi:hypothetical protein